MSTEAKLWEEIRKNLPEVAWDRIENMVGTGIPDVNGSYRGVDAWIELKIVRSKKITVRISQLAWARRRLASGSRNNYILARDGDRLRLWRGEQGFYVRDATSPIALAAESESFLNLIHPASLTWAVDQCLVKLSDDSVTYAPAGLETVLSRPFDWHVLRARLFGN